MAVGALIGAYQEDDTGLLRALLPLAGRTVIEYQVRCAAAAGAAPIVVVVERRPPALVEAFERLRHDGVAVTAVGADEAVARFETGSMVLLVGDGVVMPLDLLIQLADEREPAIAIVPDDEAHAAFERVDSDSRWAGVALVERQVLSLTVAMLGDWDLQSTLLRATLQNGAAQVPTSPDAEPLIAERPEQLAGFERTMVAGSRVTGDDWASRFVLQPIEDFATGRLMDSPVRPGWLMWAAIGLNLAAAILCVRGWLWPGLGLLVLASPLDLVAVRLAKLRLKPIAPDALVRRLLWPAAGAVLLALAWRLWSEGLGWGPLATAIGALAFAEAGRIEARAGETPWRTWLFSRRNAVLAAVPLALVTGWTGTVIALALYAATSFFLVQHARHLEN